MNIFRRYKTLWMAGIIVVIAILFIVNFSHVVAGANSILGACSSLIAGASLAFILNMILDPVENLLKKSKKKFVVKNARSIGVLISFLVVLSLIAVILAIVIPNMVNAIQVLSSEAPEYFNQAQTWIKNTLDKYPALQTEADSLNLNWTDIINSIVSFLSKGTSNVMGSTMNMVSTVVGGLVNLFIIVIFSSYVLSDKERFVRLYHYLCDLYLPEKKSEHLTRNLRIFNESFQGFIGGELIEAAILAITCIVGMLILQLPYATMIGILVGVINMIPMVGAFIGGGIGAFIIFTVSPVKCLIFIIFLCVIQQIESNVFFPKVIGNRIGLPGIYVMMTIVIGGSLFGILGMILGVPFAAAIYKILRNHLQEKAAQKHVMDVLETARQTHEEQKEGDGQTV